MYTKLLHFRLLLWAEYLKERTDGGTVRTTEGSSSIKRSNMDGSSLSLVIDGFTDLYCFILDRQHGRMYLEYKDIDGFFAFNTLEGHKPLLFPAFSSDFLGDKVLLYVSGDFFICISLHVSQSQVILIDATEGVGNLTVLYHRSDETRRDPFR